MDRSNRKDNRVPRGLSFLMWPALLRAPWLIGDVMADGMGIDDRREAERRRRRDR